jgi:putrescine:ornithine antiporter
VAVGLVATLYSTYAIYASGASAVLGGTVVMALGFVIFGFLAPRFALGTGQAMRNAAVVALVLLAAAAPARAGVLERVRESGKLRVGYRADARPFSFEELDSPAGYSVALCLHVANALKADLGREVAVESVKVGSEDRFEAVTQGKIDVLCGAATATLERRKLVDFSIPIFPGGIGALLRRDSPERLQAVLDGREPPYTPRWRASLGQVLEKRVLSAVGGTTAAAWLVERKNTLRVDPEIVPVAGYAEGVERVLTGRSAALFGDRAILLDMAERSAAPQDLVVLGRQYTYEPIALALPRGDEDFRLVVDRTLSRLFRSSEEFEPIYTRYFGKPDASTLAFFRSIALPD